MPTSTGVREKGSKVLLRVRERSDQEDEVDSTVTSYERRLS